MGSGNESQSVAMDYSLIYSDVIRDVQVYRCLSSLEYTVDGRGVVQEMKNVADCYYGTADALPCR